MSTLVATAQFTKEELVEVERFRLFLRVTGHMARTVDEHIPPSPTLFELLRAADPSVNWKAWLGLAPPKARILDDYPALITGD